MLVSDPTEDGYNSFVSLDQADEYFAGVYFGDGVGWDDLGDEDNREDQERLLISASRLVSNLPWTGAPLSASQVLAFPRSYVSYEYGGTTAVGLTETPSWLTAAVCEWARVIWTEAQRSVSDSDFSQFKSISIEGALSVTMRDSAPRMPSSVQAILAGIPSGYLTLSTSPRSMSMSL